MRSEGGSSGYAPAASTTHGHNKDHRPDLKQLVFGLNVIIYKDQPCIEKRHALFKTELGIAPVYLKKPNRAAGLIHATFLAMMVDALIERTVRRSMVRRGIDRLPILPEGRWSPTPTTARILETFSDVAWYEFERPEDQVVFPIRLTPLQQDLLKLLTMDTSAYR